MTGSTRTNSLCCEIFPLALMGSTVIGELFGTNIAVVTFLAISHLLYKELPSYHGRSWAERDIERQQGSRYIAFA